MSHRHENCLNEEKIARAHERNNKKREGDRKT